MARKTFNVAGFKTWVNEQLVNDNHGPDFKQGLCAALSHTLHKTDNYNGFGFVYKDDVRPCIDDKGNSVVINPEWTKDREYRRVYY